MDIGGLVVDLVSAVMVASVFAIAVVRADSAPTEKYSASDELADRGYYGSNPFEDEHGSHGA